MTDALIAILAVVLAGCLVAILVTAHVAGARLRRRGYRAIESPTLRWVASVLSKPPDPRRGRGRGP
jgi:hypothetical protein